MKHLKKTMTKRDLIYFVAGVLLAALFAAADLLIKQVIIQKVIYGGEVVVIKNFFAITHIRNSGAAWGIFSSATWLLSVITIFASLLVIYAIYAAAPNKPAIISLAAILGGACGNLAERLRLGYVTDFLSFHFFGYHFPNFNFADMCITVGCIFFAVYFLIPHKKSLFREGTVAYRIFKD